MIYLISIGIFFTIMMTLVVLLFLIQKKVVKQGNCQVLINEDESKSPSVGSGTNLLTALSNNKIFIPSACGGGGSCGMCKVVITDGGGDVLPTELPHLSLAERKAQVRLSCQLKVKNDMKIEIPEEIFGIQKYECEVISNENVATFIKELNLKLPEGNQDINFRAGGYIQIDIPAYDNLKYDSFIVEDEYREDWDKFNVWDNVAANEEDAFRAYSMANYPEERGLIKLNVRIASPPPGKDVPPGIGSSYIFNLKPGDKAVISGPYGEFYAKETEREMCFIGGGAGMAPMRSHIFDQLKRIHSDRKITFWYGARSKREMFYHEEFLELEKKNPNFTYHVALSDPLPEDNWTGFTGFIHNVLHDEYLKNHDDATEVEYYLCGPPIMLKCGMEMLDNLGVEKEMIDFDDFG